MDIFKLKKEQVNILDADLIANGNIRERIYPSFLQRVIATCIDMVFWYVLYNLVTVVIMGLIGFLFGLVTGYLGLVEYFASFNTDNNLLELLDIINYSSAFISIAIFSLFESCSWQSTPGKRFLKIIVTDIEGGRVLYRRALFRNILKVVIVLTLGIGYILILFTKQRQALHDKISDTLVLKEK